MRISRIGAVLYPVDYKKLTHNPDTPTKQPVKHLGSIAS